MSKLLLPASSLAARQDERILDGDRIALETWELPSLDCARHTVANFAAFELGRLDLCCRYHAGAAHGEFDFHAPGQLLAAFERAFKAKLDRLLIALHDFRNVF